MQRNRMLRQEQRRLELEMKEKRLQDSTNTHQNDDVKMRDESATCVKVASDENLAALNDDPE